MKSQWKLAGELLAASFLEICPDVVFSDIWVGHLGFYIDYTLPFPLTKEHLSRIEEGMYKKIRNQISCERFEMSVKNVIECLRAKNQYRLARAIDRSRGSLEIIKIEGYIGVVDEEVSTDLKELQAIALEAREGRIFGLAFASKEKLKTALKLRKEGKNLDHLAIGEKEGLFQKEGEEIYWLPKGVLLRKRLEKQVEDFLIKKGYQEVEFSGSIDWYTKKGFRNVFTTLEEEENSRLECGLKDYLLQKFFYVANSSLQMFNDFGKIVPLNFEFREGFMICKDFYETEWEVVTQTEGGVKIWIDRIVAMLVEKREFLVC